MAQSRAVVLFRRLAMAGALLAAGVIVLGAYVRLSDAGLGCPDWPGCYGHLYPQTGHPFGKAIREMVHRYFATTLGAIIVSLLITAVVRRRQPGQPLVPVVVLFILVCCQGALGALTVTLLLKPLIVTSHLLGGLATLALLTWLASTPELRASTPAERDLRGFALVGAAVLMLQISLGGWTSTNYAAVACPDFPTCQQRGWPDMDFRDAFVLWRGLGIDYEGGVLANPARMAIHYTHRIGAVVAGVTLVTLGMLVALRASSPRLVRAGVLLVLAVLLQIGLGISTVLLAVPLPLATLHNAGAAFLVFCMVRLLRALWPAPAVAVIPLARGHRT